MPCQYRCSSSALPTRSMSQLFHIEVPMTVNSAVLFFHSNKYTSCILFSPWCRCQSALSVEQLHVPCVSKPNLVQLQLLRAIALFVAGSFWLAILCRRLNDRKPLAWRTSARAAHCGRNNPSAPSAAGSPRWNTPLANPNQEPYSSTAPSLSCPNPRKTGRSR